MAREAGGFAVLLDGLRLRTPGDQPLSLPTAALAEAIAQEWRAQGETVIPETMPLTRLANVAAERTPRARAALAAEIENYGETDLLHHRAEGQEELSRRQAEAWDPLLAWAEAALSFQAPVVSGVMAPPRDAARLRELAGALEEYALTALAHATALFGSAVLAFALLRGRLGGAEAYALSRLDEEFQAERWGRDEEAAARAARLEAEALAVARFLRLLEQN